MSLNLVNKTTGDLEKVAGNATDKVGNLNSATTMDKSSVVAMVNEVNGKVSDTGWIQIDTSGIFYRKSGNIVAIRGETVANTTSWTLLATLPQGCRPVDTFMRALRAVPQDDKLSSLYVTQTGEIYAESDVATKFQEIFFI